MDAFYDLWMHKHEAQGKINLTIFFVNLFLILCHIFFLVIFILVKHNLMIIYNILSSILYICMFHTCYKKPEVYVGISFLEILIYMILCIFAFGLNAGFQNWSFAVITASYLPTYKTPDAKKTRKMSILYSIVVVSVYLLFYIFRGSVTLPIYSPLNDTYTKFLFIFNSTLTFFTIIMFALSFSYRTQRREFELTRKADYDELTNLYNRYAISELHTQIKNESLSENKCYSIAILDIDFFKKVNDQYGHNSGDLILKDIANMIKLLGSKNLIPGRWGGEEFILLAPSTIKYKEFLDILKKLNLKISKTKFKVESGEEINLTISIGSVSIPPGLTTEEAVGMADKNLYEAKGAGRNKVIG